MQATKPAVKIIHESHSNANIIVASGIFVVAKIKLVITKNQKNLCNSYKCLTFFDRVAWIDENRRYLARNC